MPVNFVAPAFGFQKNMPYPDNAALRTLIDELNLEFAMIDLLSHRDRRVGPFPKNTPPSPIDASRDIVASARNTGGTRFRWLTPESNHADRSFVAAIPLRGSRRCRGR